MVDAAASLRSPLDHLWIGNLPTASAIQSGDPMVLARGEGIYLWDMHGTRYIDAIASLEAVAIGHGRPEIADAVGRQYAQLEFYDTLRFTSEPTIELARRLAELSPMPDSRVHFATSGSEAVEAALKIARQFHLLNGDPLRTKVIGRRGGYHGCTVGAMALDGNYYRTKRHYFESVPDVGRFVPVPTTVDMIADLIEFERAETVSAVVLDPMSTASGVYESDDSFWRDLRTLCDERGILLIADEVITAFGRTGRWFASARGGVAPDLITVSKALSSGYFPISGVIARGSVSGVFEEQAAGLSHGHTFGGHPVAAAAALANLRIIEAEGLVENAVTVGAHLRSGLESLLESTNLVTDVRGEGLLYGVSLHDAMDARNNEELGPRVVRSLREHGVLTFVLHPGNVLLFCPPLTIRQDQVDDLVERVGLAIRAV